MKKWLKEVKTSLAEALKKSEGSDIPLKNLYMIAPILYSEKFNCNNEALLQNMLDVNNKQVTSDWALDENSKNQYKFHYVSSYLFCFVVADKIDEFKYDQIMEYVCRKMDLFTDDYDGL